ncbi:MAG: phosphonoacetaldehyde dehydrogenase, partial [Rhizobacter sp.]
MSSTLNHDMQNPGMRIAGEKIGMDRSGDRCIRVFNPFTNECIGSVPKATLVDVRHAFAIAK